MKTHNDMSYLVDVKELSNPFNSDGCIVRAYFFKGSAGSPSLKLLRKVQTGHGSIKFDDIEKEVYPKPCLINDDKLANTLGLLAYDLGYEDT